MFELGDKVVYPMHGAGIIEAIEEKEILGKKSKYYILKMPVGKMKLMLPVDNVENIGIRDIVGEKQIDDVISILKEKVELTDLNWNKRYRSNMEKIKSGDILEVTEVIRDLSCREKQKGLSTGEKRMLSNAKQILVSEIALVEERECETVQEEIDCIIEQN